MATDDDPLRYHPLRIAIEGVLVRRALEGKLQGFTRETSSELVRLIYEILQGDDDPSAAKEA